MDISTSIICCRRASFSSSAFARFSSTVSSSWCNRTDTSLATCRDSHPGMKLSERQGCIQTTFEAESLSDTVLCQRAMSLAMLTSRFLQEGINLKCDVHIMRKNTTFIWIKAPLWIALFPYRILPRMLILLKCRCFKL